MGKVTSRGCRTCYSAGRRSSILGANRSAGGVVGRGYGGEKPPELGLAQAVAVPHNFPTGQIYIRETTSRKVGSLDFRAADPIGGPYRTGRPRGIERSIAEMTDAIKWH